MSTAWHDDQYLFRLTSTFGWEEAVVFCDALVAGIEGAAAANDRNQDEIVVSGSPSKFNDALHSRGPSAKNRSLSDWLKHAENQLMFRDQWGNTPLHATSYVQPPTGVVNALFEVGRAIWKYSPDKPKTPVWAVPSKDNSTPFLVACSTGMDFNGLIRYLDEIEYYIEQNWVTSHARKLVLHPDNQGTTPLNGWSSFHLGIILQQGMRTDLLYDYTNLVTRMLWNATRDVYPEYPTTKEMKLIRITYIAYHFPEPLLSLLLGHENRDVLATTTDQIARLPLHNAIDAVKIVTESFNDLIQVNSSSSITPTTTEFFYNSSYERNRIGVIQNLLEWYPDSARKNFPDNGQSTLCRAITVGDRWHTKNAGYGVVQLLCEHAPDKLEEKDSETGLYSFMLAATSCPSTIENETSVVETIYQLLKQYPQPIIDSIL